MISIKVTGTKSRQDFFTTVRNLSLRKALSDLTGLPELIARQCHLRKPVSFAMPEMDLPLANPNDRPDEVDQQLLPDEHDRISKLTDDAKRPIP